MNKPVSVEFQFSIKQRGRGAKKQIVEGRDESQASKTALERIPRISRYMALAIHFEELIRQGVVTDYADLARLGHVTRARVTQIMNLRLLAPELQEDLLSLDQNTKRKGLISLQTIQSVTSEPCWQRQRELWRGLIS